MDDLTYTLHQLYLRNRDGSFATQADRQRSLTLAARQLREAGFLVNLAVEPDDTGFGRAPEYRALDRGPPLGLAQTDVENHRVALVERWRGSVPLRPIRVRRR
jgi:hypothetical protein